MRYCRAKSCSPWIWKLARKSFEINQWPSYHNPFPLLLKDSCRAVYERNKNEILEKVSTDVNICLQFDKCITGQIDDRMKESTHDCTSYLQWILEGCEESIKKDVVDITEKPESNMVREWVLTCQRLFFKNDVLLC